MSVTVYSNTDSSAPTITRTSGSLITFFDKVLVSGYGTQSSCGWTKLYGTSTDAVYKAPTALGDFSMYISDDIITTYNHWYAKVRFVSGSASGIDTGEGVKWPPFTGGIHSLQAAVSSPQHWYGIVKTTTNLTTSTAVRWSLINNSSKGFYLWIDNNNETAVAKPSVGTFYAVVKPKTLFGEPETGIMTMFRNTSVGSLTWNNYDLQFATNIGQLDSRYHHKCIYNYNNNNSIILADFSPSAKTMVNADIVGSAATNYAGYPSLTGEMMVAHLYLICEEGYSGGRYIGRLPGVLQPLHNRPLDHGGTIAGSSPYATSSYVAWCIHSGQVLIDTTDNW